MRGVRGKNGARAAIATLYAAIGQATNQHEIKILASALQQVRCLCVLTQPSLTRPPPHTLAVT